jgi:DNA-binding transcriptional ArsR family regulator
MVNPQSTVTLDATFAALADPTRRAILTRLRSGPATVGELAEPFEVSAPAISKHLALLERRGLIRRRREGRHHRVSLDARPLEEAERWLARYRRFWEARLDALESHLEAAKEEDHDPS